MTSGQDKPLARVLVAAAAFLLCYAGVLWSLADLWATNSTYSYGFAVPLISAYIVWSRWSDVKRAYSAPDYLWGCVLLLVGVTMLTIGHLGALMSLEGTSLIPTLAGLVLLLGGRQVLRVVWFPLTYLLLMLPLWSYLFRGLELPSQQLSATIGTRLLTAAGVPALQQGTRIVLSSVSLDVLPECSGINQLIALTVMALPAAYLWLDRRATRLALISIALVAGYLSNGARIAVLGLLTVKGINVSDTHSPIHLLPGFLTASLAYLTIWGCLSLFSRLNRSQSSHIESGPSDGRDAIHKRRIWVDATVLGAMVCVSAVPLLAARASVRSDFQLESLPREIAGWRMESGAEPTSARFLGFDVDLVGGYSPHEQRHFTGVDDQVLRTYRNANGRLQLYVGYYASQGREKELASDISRGLQRASSSVALASGPGTLILKEVEQREAGRDRGVIFWYDVNGRVVASLYAAKGYTLWDTLTRRRSNGAVIMIAWDVRDGGNRQDAIAFAEALLPVLRGYLPS
jgi:EpsI family protein